MQSGVLTADIGTSSLKAAFITEKGAVLQSSRVLFPQSVQAVDWVKAFLSVWAELVPKYNITALCISGNGPTLVGVPNRSRGIPVNAIKNSECPFNLLIDQAQEDALFLWNEPIGHAAMPDTHSLFIPRLFAFKTHHPHVWKQCRHLLSGPEYLMYILTGNAVTVLPEQRYKLAYWDTATLQKWGLETNSLAPFVPLGTEIGSFCGVPVIASGPDFIAALIGTNTLHTGAACDRAGSSEGINICIAKPCTSKQTLVLPSVIANLWNISYLIPHSGSSFAQFIAQEGFSPHSYRSCMEKIMSEPFRLSAPYPNTQTGRGRTFIEERGFHLRTGFNCIEQSSGHTPLYTLSGGQSKNAIWCQFKADITGRTFALPHCADAELLGNAALAFYTLGYYSTLSTAAANLSTIDRFYEPEPHTATLYSEKYAAFCNQKAAT
ncbi:MAG: FGGY-family carbohydrate kinase [Treponema sp.]